MEKNVFKSNIKGNRKDESRVSPDNKIKRHSRMSLSEILTAFNNAQGRDPEQKRLRMTTNLNAGQALPDNETKCHSRMSLSGIPTAFNNAQGGDPRLKPSGMTAPFKEEALNRNPFRAPLHYGFTLIELLVVVLIIAILAAIALPQYQKAVAKSRYGAVKSLVVRMAHAAELYYLAHGQYPTAFNELEIELPEGNKENSDSNHYHYDWGWCRLFNSAFHYGDRLTCHDNTLAMEYEIYFQYSKQAANMRCCVIRAQDLSDWRNKICQAEMSEAKGALVNNQYISYCIHK